MKAVAATFGVARSNLVEQLQRPKRPQRGPYRRAEDEAVLGEIRAITDARPTYGYRPRDGLVEPGQAQCRRATDQSQARLSAHAPLFNAFAAPYRQAPHSRP